MLSLPRYVGSCALAALTLALCWGPPASGHAVPAVVTAADGRLTLQGSIPVGELLVDGAALATDSPGFGVTFEASGPPVGTSIGLEVLSGLAFWDGSARQPTSASLRIDAPEIDSRGISNNAGVEVYTIVEGSAPQSGMTWHTYPGGDFWDADGRYVLEGAESDPIGLYGVVARLYDASSVSILTPSDPFFMPFLFDPDGDLRALDLVAGAEFLEAWLTQPLPGDFNGDRVVDQSDFSTWLVGYGDTYNAAEYTIWRDALDSSPKASSVPEPPSLIVVLGLLLFLTMRIGRCVLY